MYKEVLLVYFVNQTFVKSGEIHVRVFILYLYYIRYELYLTDKNMKDKIIKQ